MTAIIFLIVLLAIAVVAFLASPYGDEDYKRFRIAVLLGSSAAFLVVLMATSHVIIASQQRGLIRTFGVVNDHRSYAPGFNLKFPWEIVEKIDVAWENMYFMGDQDTDSSYSKVGNYTTDKVWMWADVTVRWAINPSQLEYTKSKMPSKGVYTAAIWNISRNATKKVLGLHRWDDATVLNRENIRAEIDAAIRSGTESYFRAQGFGDRSKSVIIFGETLVGTIVPDSKTEIALDDLNAAVVARQVNPVPNGLTPEQFARIQTAMALREAVAKGSPVTVIVGDGNTPVAVRAQ